MKDKFKTLGMKYHKGTDGQKTKDLSARQTIRKTDEAMASMLSKRLSQQDLYQQTVHPQFQLLPSQQQGGSYQGGYQVPNQGGSYQGGYQAPNPGMRASPPRTTNISANSMVVPDLKTSGSNANNRSAQAHYQGKLKDIEAKLNQLG